MCFHEGMGAGQKTQGRGMVCVSRGLVARLSCSDLFFQCGVEFVQVDKQTPVPFQMLALFLGGQKYSDDNLCLHKRGRSRWSRWGHHCKQILRGEGDLTSYPVGSYYTPGGIVPVSGSFVWSDRHLPDGNPQVKWSHISSAFPRDLKKCDTNLDLQSEVMWEGTPCLENT